MRHAFLLLLFAALLTGCQGFAALDQPPEASFTITPDPANTDPHKPLVRVGEAVTLDASSSSDPQGYDLSYQWELTAPSNSLVRLSSTTGKVVTFYPENVGISYPVKLRVTARSQASESNFRTVTAQVSDERKVLVTVVEGKGGRVEPFGVRAVLPSEVLPLEASAAAGYRFQGWKILQGAPALENAQAAKTSLTVSGVVAVTIEAQFEETNPPPEFLGGLDAKLGYGLAKVDGEEGTVSRLGGNLIFVALARNPAGVLYGIGDTFSPRGARLFVLDSATGEPAIEEGVAFHDEAGTPVTVAGAAFSPSGQLYVVEEFGTHRLFRAEVATGVLSPVAVSFASEALPELDSLAFDAKGALYGLSETALYVVDPYTAKFSLVANTDTNIKLSSLTSSSTGVMYALGRVTTLLGGSVDSIYSLDPQTAEAEKLVTLPKGGLLSLICGI